jgi:hypothetical protein
MSASGRFYCGSDACLCGSASTTGVAYRDSAHLQMMGLKIPRRKACRFDSGPGHQRFRESDHYHSRNLPHRYSRKCARRAA